MPPVSLFVALLSGVLFGAGMNVSGMVDPANIFAFLDITGEWDPSLAFVMGGELCSYLRLSTISSSNLVVKLLMAMRLACLRIQRLITNLFWAHLFLA